MTLYFSFELNFHVDDTPGGDIRARMARCLPHYASRLCYELRRLFGLHCDSAGQDNLWRADGIDVRFVGSDPTAETWARNFVLPGNVGTWQIARQRLRAFLNSGESVWLRTASVLNRGEPMISYETAGNVMYMNPFTWFAIGPGGNFIRPSLQASSERAEFTMGPAMHLLHETCHMYDWSCLRPAPGRICAVRSVSVDQFNTRVDAEQNITSDVDEVTVGMSDVIPRRDYGSAGAGGESRFGPGRTEWVRWPTEGVLRNGLL